MSTETAATADWDADSPWRRLPWTLPGALLVWAIVFIGFADLIGKAPARLPEPPPIDAQIIELPPPPVIKPAPVQKPAAPPPPRPAVTQAAARPATPQPIATPVPSAPVPPAPALHPDPVPPAPPPVPPTPLKPASTANNLTGNSAAQAIVRPMPRIPDALRESVLNTSATARFHIAPDGSATVELVKPTPDPTLNQRLLSTLARWRFFPAMQDGKPTASIQDIVIKLDVK
jgi:protein TonB